MVKSRTAPRADAVAFTQSLSTDEMRFATLASDSLLATTAFIRKIKPELAFAEVVPLAKAVIDYLNETE